MQRQQDIEIYARDCTVEELVAWSKSKLGGLGRPEALAGSTLYESPRGPLTVTKGMGDGTFVSLWFNSSRTPWATDVDCAREAARELRCTVRCDPGQHYPDVAPQSAIFLEVVGEREHLVNWET